MKQRQYITALTMIVALTGLSPVVAADAGRTSGGERIQPDQRQSESSLEFRLSPEQMDTVRAGRIRADVPAHVQDIIDKNASKCGNVQCLMNLMVFVGETIQAGYIK